MPELVGFLIVLLATSAYAHCAWLFVARGRGTPLPFAPPREFVARGLYRYTRNPMALSVIAGVAGVALLLGSPIGFGLAGLLALALHLYITLREEPELRRRFGEAYGSYCRQVPRWLPRIHRAGA